METSVIDYTNFKKQSICCVQRDRNGEGRIEAKRNWLEGVFEDGLVIRKGEVPGKVFMEYVPADDAWCPVDAPDYMFIHCYRSDEKYRGQGYATAIWREVLAECCIKHKFGLCVVVGSEDLPYLNKKADFESRGFRLAEKVEPYFELWYLPLTPEAAVPRFLPEMAEAEVEDEGWVLYYSHQCPHTAKAVPLLQAKAKELGVALKVIYLDKQKEARALPVPFTSFALFRNGEYITQEILSPAKFAKLVKKYK